MTSAQFDVAARPGFRVVGKPVHQPQYAWKSWAMFMSRTWRHTCHVLYFWKTGMRLSLRNCRKDHFAGFMSLSSSHHSVSMSITPGLHPPSFFTSAPFVVFSIEIAICERICCTTAADSYLQKGTDIWLWSCRKSPQRKHMSFSVSKVEMGCEHACCLAKETQLNSHVLLSFVSTSAHV
jgi:hypothetical protein